MAMPKSLIVAGIPLNVYNLNADSKFPVAVLFHLHGRFGNHLDAGTTRYVNAILEQTGSLGKEKGKKDLVIVTFDQRNHGSRVGELDRNRGWRDDFGNRGEETEEQRGKFDNETHAIDMVSIQTGTAADVSHLIDYIPAALFPNDEREVTDWYVSGVSLGGHVAWIVASRDPRIRLVIPIIGSPSSYTLLSHRASHTPPPLGPLSLSPPLFPKSLVRAMKANDPDQQPSSVWTNKKILILSGADDKLVNYVDGGTRAFVEGHLKGWSESGQVKGLLVEKWVQEGVGHACTDEMTTRAAEWLWEKGLSVSSSSTGGESRL